MKLFSRLRAVIVRRILGLEDTPHSIAWGVFLGLLVAWTPTLGFQILIYLAVATLLRANKISGIPLLFISNPVSAVPLYYFCWVVGHGAMHDGAASESQGDDIRAQLAAAGEADFDVWAQIFNVEFWHGVWDALVAMGAEMWMGSLIMGVATGIPGYILTRWGVTLYRRAQGRG